MLNAGIMTAEEFEDIINSKTIMVFIQKMNVQMLDMEYI